MFPSALLHNSLQCGCVLSDWSVNQVDRFNPDIGSVHSRIQGEDNLLVIVLDLLQGGGSRLRVSSLVMDSVT